MNNKLLRFEINPVLLIINVIILFLIFIWQSWIGLLLFTMGQFTAIANRVIVNAKKGCYDDKKNKW